MKTVLLNPSGGVELGGGWGGNACRSGMSGMRASIRKRTKTDVFEKFIESLKRRGDVQVEEAGFVTGIREHFKQLPTRYALDVNVEGLDVLNHKKLLDEARSNPESIAFQVRQVEVLVPRAKEPPHTHAGGEAPSPRTESFSVEIGAGAGNHLSRSGSGSGSALFRPAFASSPNLQAMILDSMDQDEGSDDGTEAGDLESILFFEISVGAKDRPRLLSKLSKALGDAGLNIKEAHVFNTNDKFSLDVFVADGWDMEGKDGLEDLLKEHFGRQLQQSESQSNIARPSLELPEDPQDVMVDGIGCLDDWEIDISKLQIISRIASGAFGNLYKGLYYGQEVAVKVIKDVQKNEKQFQEFIQEVAIMKKIRHKNVVQFIGACTARPNLCILFEFMSGGSVHDQLRKTSKGIPLSVEKVLELSVNIARAMSYLHQMNIIHRDLKAANLLLDENENVKIGDFGVARIMEQTGYMTAETGTYRWMAPEVIEHRPYDCKADVFSFGILLWELLTAEIPYTGMTPLQAAVGVVQKGLRPDIPSSCPVRLTQLMEKCWEKNPGSRPSFQEMIPVLKEMHDEARRAASTSKPFGTKSGLLTRIRSIGGGNA